MRGGQEEEEEEEEEEEQQQQHRWIRELYTDSQTSSLTVALSGAYPFSLGLEVTELSTNKQHTHFIWCLSV